MSRPAEARMSSSRTARILSAIATILLAAFLTTCGGDSGNPTSPPPPPPPPPPPVATTIAVTPPTSTFGPGQTAQLAAEVRDAAGAVMTGVTVTWSTSDAAIATVTSGGLATGVNLGDATITATSGGASGTAALTVQLQNLTITADTTLSGTVTVDDFTVAAGATVTVAADLVVDAAGEVIIDGSMEGDCVAVTLMSGGDSVRVTGGISNPCGAGGGAEALTFTVLAAGGLSFEGSAILSGGEILISNDPAAAVPTHRPFRGRNQEPGRTVARDLFGDCLFNGGTTQTQDGNAGAAGSPAGETGKDGARIMVQCGGRVRSFGHTFEAGDGGDGGNGTAVGAEGTAAGGSGGKAGAIFVTSTGVAEFGAGLTTLRSGAGGSGGTAIAQGTDDSPDAAAHGGDGSAGGFISILSLGNTTGLTIQPGSLALEVGQAGSGGEARANAEDGKDATSSEEAKPGGNAEATAGVGGDDFPQVNWGITAILNVGFATTGTSTVTLSVPPAGHGGRAVGSAGQGGTGSHEFKDGAVGGDLAVLGGGGGKVQLADDRFVLVTYPSTPGDGGDAVFRGAHGGFGWADCRVDEGGGIEAGGGGAKAGMVLGEAGGAGAAPDGEMGSPGMAELSTVGNGGDGGAGDPPGGGGAQGDDLVTGPRAEEGDNFEAGLDGGTCSAFYDSNFQLRTDPSDLEGALGLVGPMDIFIPLGPGLAIVFSGDFPLPTLEGQFDPATGGFTAIGSRNISGLGGVAMFSLTGTLITDSEGRAVGYTGELSVSSPRGDAIYDVSGTIQQGG